MIVGDVHNFGRCVSLSGDGKWVIKPRPVYWERAFLSPESPFRKALAKCACFDSLPSLAIEALGEAGEGRAERIVVSELSAFKVDAHALRSVGRIVALCQWFGIGDLHRENICVGFGREGEFVLAPLDVEAVFEQHPLPSDSLIIANAAHHNDAIAGLCSIRERLDDMTRKSAAAAAIWGYFDAFDRLSSLAAELDAALMASVPERAVSRVFLRDTAEYAAITERRITEAELDVPLVDAEREQLARGDIPYFFRYAGSNEVRHYTTAALDSASAQLSPGLVARRSLSFQDAPLSGGRSIDPAMGALQLARYFDPGRDGAQVHKDVAVLYREDGVALRRQGLGDLCCRRVVR